MNLPFNWRLAIFASAVVLGCTTLASRAAERLGVRVLSAECRGGLCRAELTHEREACAGRKPQRVSGGGDSDLFRFCEAGTWRSVAFFPDSEASKHEGSNP